MRALLIANPKATSTSQRARDLLIRALSGNVDLEVAHTRYREHAAALARRAAEEGYDTVITLGGDGTINEVVNGLLAHGPAPELPALGILPGGSANVFARALGMPRNPIHATRTLLDALRSGRHRTIGLGAAETAAGNGSAGPGRYFTFNAGVGLDAEVVRLVEEMRGSGSRADPTLYLRATLRRFFSGTDRRTPALTVERPGHRPLGGMFMAIVSNTAPWTYLGPRPVNPTPRAHFGCGLDLFGMRTLAVPPVLAAAAQMLTPRTRSLRGRHLVNVHDATELTLRSVRPIAFQLDGEYLGVHESITFRSVPKAIRIVI